MRLLGSDRRGQRQNLATLALLLLLAVVAAWTWWADPLRDWSRRITDGFIPQEQASQNIVVVAIDDAALDRYGSFNAWPHTLHARAIEQLHAAGARVIVYDVLFEEAEAGDSALRAAMERNPVVLSVRGRDPVARNGQVRFATVELPTPPLFEAAAGLGHVNIATDGDGVTRRMPARITMQTGETYPPLAAIAVQRFLRPNDRSLPIIEGRHLKLLGRTAPLDGHLNLRLAYAGNVQRFRTLSFIDVVEGDFSPAAVAGKLVLIGMTAVATADYPPTPAGRMAGVTLQANAIDTLLKGRFIREVALAPVLAIGGALAGALSLLMVRRSMAAGVGATIGLAVAYILTSWLLPLAGWLIDPLYVPLLLALALAGSLVWRLASEHAERLLFSSWFKRVAPPEVVRELERGGMEALRPFEVGALRLKRYLILEELGSGATGVVYKARDLRDGKVVAVKRLYPHLARDLRALERFRREAQLLRRLRSPYIVRLLDFVEEEQPPLLVTEFLPGGSLQERLRREGPFPPTSAARIIAQAAQGLAHAWKAGVLHRDIKPSNILLSEQGVAKVTDFGLARANDAGAVDSTLSEGFAGTLRYAAPEASAGVVDARSDVYSLGLVFYELVTGRPAFSGATPFEVEASRAHWVFPDDTPFQVVPEIEQILRRCLASDPDARFQDAGELVQALTQQVGSVEVPV